MNEKNKEISLVDLKDNIGHLSDCIEIIYRTHLAIENGDYDERPSIGSIILFDYLVKSKEILETIKDVMEGAAIKAEFPL